MAHFASKLLPSSMKPWPFISLLLLAQQPLLFAQELSAHEQKGHIALADELWEVAELHFRNHLADPQLSPEAKSQATIRLAESIVRQGNPDEALRLLDASFIAKHAEAAFWKAQALVGKRRFKDAAEIFSSLLNDPTTPHHTEAGFTQVSLLLALDQTKPALDLLTQLLDKADAATAIKIKLYQVDILLSLDRYVDARLAMPALDGLSEADRQITNYFTAQILLDEGKASDAEIIFRNLVNQPQGQSLARFHSAAIGLAEALHAQNKTDEATQSLLTFLQERPDSPALEAMFQKLLEWIPEKPTPTDPILEQLAKWISPPTFPVTGLISNGPAEQSSNASAAWFIHRETDGQTNRSVYSLYVRAIGLDRIDTPESQAEAKRLLNQLRTENADHPLADRTLYQLARWSLDAGEIEKAFSMLTTLRESSGIAALKGEAAFLEARTLYDNGDPKAAIKLFEEAANALAGANAQTAKLQAAIARIRSLGPKGTSLIQADLNSNKELEADLSIERALSKKPLSAARPELEDFVKSFPDHPRVPEARLTALEITLTSPAADLDFSRAQLAALAENAQQLPAEFKSRIALAQLRIADLTKDAAAITELAPKLIDAYIGSAESEEAALILGRHLFQSGNYNAARLVLEKLAAAPGSDPLRAQPAWLLSARAAALGGTPQSKEQAIVLFDKAIQSGGPLNAVATLEKASHLISMYRLAEAANFLEKWTQTLPENDPLQLPAGLLLGEALYAQGSSNPASLIDALAVYDRLLAQAKTHPALFNRLQYLRGITLEQLPDEKDSTQKRDKQAFQAFHSVLETTTTPAEWEYFERCSFRALALLEKSERWSAAITVAKKIASFKGPRAEEAATRATQLQLKHMIWED